MGKFKNYIIGAFIFLTASSFIYSENSFIKEYVSRNWNASSGLPANSITDLLQKDDGYIYIGSYDGLVRFDGVEFLSINKNSNLDINFVSARALFQDSKKNFWIGANDEGVTCIRQDGKVVLFTIENGLPNNSVRAICEDLQGRIWVGTSAGICFIQDDVVVIPEGIDVISNNNKIMIKNLYCDTAGRVWISTIGETGLILYHNEKFEYYNRLKSFSHHELSYVTQDSSGVYWFGANPHYAVKYDGNSEKVYDVGFGKQQGTTITTITQDSKGNIWFGLDAGIAILNEGKLYGYETEDGLIDNKISKIIEDREGNIWIATDRAGIQMLSQAKFSMLHVGETVNAIAEDLNRNVVWLGADNGLYCYKNGVFVENKLTSLCKNIRIRHVGVTENGDVLVSSYEKLGQIKYTVQDEFVSWTKQNGFLPGNKVRVAIQASSGKYYVGTTTGLSIIDDKAGVVTQITKSNGIKNDYIMCLYEDASGKIWCGTDGGGIFILDGEKIVQQLTTEDGISGNVVFKINNLETDDEIWICTGSGVTNIKNGKLFNYTAVNGLGTDSVFQMIPDISGKIWCTSNRGILCGTSEDFKYVRENKKSRLNTRYFGASDGIVSGGITSTSVSMKDENGRIWFTMIDGVAIYNPVKSAKRSKAPIVHIQEVTIDGEKVDISEDRIVIPSNKKRLIIKYTGLSFVSAEQILFKYKLEGFDKDFSEWTSYRNVSYTNLKPGDYKFTVIAKNNEDVVSIKGDTISVEKKPAFWQRIWFWVLNSILFITLVSLAIRMRLNKLQQENNKLQRIYLELTQTLTSTIDAKDKYTKGHSSRVADYTKMIAKEMGFSKAKIHTIYMMAILHDIGKIGVPDTIINKPGKLTDEEYEIIKQHPSIGSEILKSIESLKGIETGARWHHERYDGRGYPDGLKGEQIPIEARIIGVADAYDAMTSNRSYRAFLPQTAVREQILNGKGTQFDPEIADIMLSLIDKDVNYEMHG